VPADLTPPDGADLADRLALVEAALATRWPESMIEPSLDRISELLDLLGSPQNAYPVILVAGTNGKTSTSRMIDALLTAFGLAVGRYTSPHLSSVTERISLSGSPVDVERFVDNYLDIAPLVDLVDARHDDPLSFFEVVTALGYAVFADAPVDVAVVEVGMGGTWDATNVVDARVAVVMPVGLDHQAYLGSTVEEIAGEKAGIIKPEGIAVLAQQDPAAAEVLLRRVSEAGTPVAREGVEFAVLRRELAVGGQLVTVQGLGGTYQEVFLPLHGEHQAHNAAVALAAVEAFLGGGRGLLDLDNVRQGFAAVTSPGRLELVRSSPPVLLDAAHNLDGARALAATLEEAFAATSFVAVLGILQDKDAEGIVSALAGSAFEFVLTQSASPRALPAEVLGDLAAGIVGAARVRVEPELAAALDLAVARADELGSGAGGVVVTGSVVTVAEARRLLRGPGAVG
jgi:dihydrofolate synthase/folylpolyglutamate synthase